MTPHDRTTDSLRELAQQYALGTLADAERRDFERHLGTVAPSAARRSAPSSPSPPTSRSRHRRAPRDRS